jgi:hypothetical protein
MPQVGMSAEPSDEAKIECLMHARVTTFGHTHKILSHHSGRRVAAAHRKLMLGHRWAAVSPNGRFSQGAAVIDGKVGRATHS